MVLLSETQVITILSTSGRAVFITRMALSETALTGKTSATANTYTALSSSSLLVKSFSLLSVSGNSASIFIGAKGNAARYVVPNGFITFSSGSDELIDLSDIYVDSAAASQAYVVNYET